MKILAAFVALSLVLAATPSPVVIDSSPITIPIARHVRSIGGAKAILQRDQARAAAFLQRGNAILAKGAVQPQTRAVVNEAVINEAEIYVAQVGVGSPATTYNLIVDTGSSNTWVGAGKAYARTSTSVQTSDSVSVTYGSGSFSGREFLDTVTIASGLVIRNQSIGVASRSTGFTGFDGILGIGPVDLTQDTLSPDTNAVIPTVTDNAFSQGIITSHEVAVSFNPTTSTSVTNGEITWGGTDSSKFTGSITTIAKTRTSPASLFWGIDQTITYGTTGRSILTSTAGIVDTGTTLILIATDAFNRYRTATGAVEDNTTGLLRLTTTQFASLQSLFFTAGGTSFELTANAQAWPRSLNTAIGGTAGNVYLVVNDVGTPTGSGLDFINGYTFLERYYSVFNSATGTVGFATTPNTRATTN